MRRLFGGRSEPPQALEADRLEAVRGRVLIEESRELVVVLDVDERVVAASRRAREALEGLMEGSPLSSVRTPRRGISEVARVPLAVDGRRETLVYFAEPGSLAAYEELRAGFTAAVSHELRTPLARLLALLETALLPDSDVEHLIELARAEVEQIRELIDDVLFLSELETGRQVVSLTSTPACSVLAEVVANLTERAERSGISIRVQCDNNVRLPLRPRMLRVVAENLVENAVRYAGHGAQLTLAVSSSEGGPVLVAVDNGIGVGDDDLPRLFERFYRADRARASRGTGLGLAIVKHIVTSAGGTVDALRGPDGGLTVRCRFRVR